jgi:hypothetical protein
VVLKKKKKKELHMKEFIDKRRTGGREGGEYGIRGRKKLLMSLKEIFFEEKFLLLLLLALSPSKLHDI